MNDNLPPRAAARAVRTIVQRRAANFKYAFYRLPADQRAGMEAIYAFARRADDAVDEAGTPAEKSARLAAFQRGFTATLSGAPPDPPFVALRWALDRFLIPAEPLMLILDGCARDLDNAHYGTFEEAYGYCYRVASAVGLACLPVWGVRDPAARAPAEALGIGMQWVNVIRDCREDALNGRCYFPGEELARAGLSADDFRAPPDTPEKAKALRRFLLAQIARAREFLKAGAALLPLVPENSRHCPALLRAFYAELLRDIERDPLRVLHGRVRLGWMRKIALFWRGGRGAD